MPDTFYTLSPHWGWYITFYFFVGGIAGGAFFIAALLQLFGTERDRPILRRAYYVAFIGAILSGFLLTIDLSRPERFWHMLIENNTGLPMFKYWSPMSVGAWAVLLFGLFSFLGALGAASEEGRLRWKPAARLASGLPAMLVAVIGSFFGLFLAGYTGVLLSVTNRPIWADTNFLGILFLFSGASTAAATLLLLGERGRVHADSMEWLSRFDVGALALELIALIVFLVSLGAVARVLVGWYGLLLVLGVLLLGIVVPFVLELRELTGRAHGHTMTAAALVLFGGLLLRWTVIFASEEIHRWGSGVVLP